MRVAIVHDYLSQRGGAERVVLELARLFPEAPLFTAFYDRGGTYPEFEGHRVVPSRLQGTVDPRRFRRSLLRFPAAFEELDLSAFDVVVVSTSAFAHHVRHPRTVVYCYTPPRFLYEPAAYFSNRATAGAAIAATALLRHRDRSAARRHPLLLTISETSAGRVLGAYGRDAPVLHPPLSTNHLPGDPAPAPGSARALVVCRLLPYKRVDLAIAACRAAKVPLTIAGTGPDEQRLRSIADHHVRFAGAVPDVAMAELFADHSLFLAPAAEDFGLGPLEANYAGRPVVAVARGGARETMRDGVTGRLVDGWEPRAWAEAIRDVAGTTWDPLALRAATGPFRLEVFARGIQASVETIGSLRPGAGIASGGGTPAHFEGTAPARPAGRLRRPPVRHQRVPPHVGR